MRGGSLRRILPVFVFAFLAWGCRQEKVLVLTDPWFEQLLGATRSAASTDRELRWYSLIDPKHEFHRITVRDQREAQATLDRYAAADTAFVVTPLVYLWTRQVILPAGGMVVVDGSPGWASPGKSVVWTDYGDAMEQAGRWAAQRVSDEENSVAAGIVSTLTTGESAVFDRFRAGFLALAPESALIVLPVNAVPEQIADDLAGVAGSRRVAVWFLFGGTANIPARESLEGQPAPLIALEGGPWLGGSAGVATLDTDRGLLLRKACRLAAGGRFGEAQAVPAKFKPVQIKKRDTRGKITEKGFDTP